MCAAVCSTVIAKKLRKPYVEEIFLLGLLHNLGQIVLLFRPDTSRDYKTILKKIKEEGVDYATAEQEVFGFAHPLIGALVAKKWNFSPDSCQAILHYKDPIEGNKPDSLLDEKTAVVQLAELITHAAGVGNPEGYPVNRDLIIFLAKYVGFDASKASAIVDQIIADTQAQFQNEKHIYE